MRFHLDTLTLSALRLNAPALLCANNEYGNRTMPNSQFIKYLEDREDDLVQARNNGEISETEFQKEMRALAQEERDEYEHDLQDARDRVDSDWGRH